MRPTRFTPWLQERLIESGSVAQVQTREEAGEPASPKRGPYGLLLTLRNGAVVEVGVTAESSPGDQYSEPETVVEGEPMAPLSAPAIDGAKVRTAELEAFLAALIAESSEVAAIRRFSEAESPGAVPYGLSVRYHSGAKIRVNFVTAHSSGQRPGPDYTLPDSV
ncbi:hypothetical protein [Embleya sp. AB8]|uniref:hypothetical protein n=1 Tax=Embleya sp. AB8 TaxID=3156304 RepID=UPI003C7270C0